jgi:IQ calmodulin-binding motif
MRWRVVRNKRRLARLEVATILIQKAWKNFLQRTAAHRARRHRAALCFQRVWRGSHGRAYAHEVRRIILAALNIQRVYRGHRGRAITARLRLLSKAASDIGRTWRGYYARRHARETRKQWIYAATRIQTIWRRFFAIKETIRRRIERIAT